MATPLENAGRGHQAEAEGPGGLEMKRLVLFLDGTWNQVLDPDTVTNVVKLAQYVRTVTSDGVQQIVYYNSGAGTGDLLDKFLGGVFGRGLRANVKRAYAHSCC